MPPVTTYGSIAGMQTVGVRPEAIAKFTAPEKQAALDAISKTMDMSFRKKFTLPFIQVGADIHRMANILAAYDLLSGRGFNPDADDNIVTRAEAERKTLRYIAAGLLVPDVIDSSVAAVEGSQSGGPQVISSASRGYSVRGAPFSGFGRGPFQGQ